MVSQEIYLGVLVLVCLTQMHLCKFSFNEFYVVLHGIIK